MSPAGEKTILEKYFYRNLADMVLIEKKVMSLPSRLSNVTWPGSTRSRKLDFFEEKQEEIVKSMNVVMCLMVLEDKTFVA